MKDLLLSLSKPMPQKKKMWLVLLLVTGASANRATFYNSQTCSAGDLAYETDEAASRNEGCSQMTWNVFYDIQTTSSTPIGPRWAAGMTYYDSYEYSDASCTSQIEHRRRRTEFEHSVFPYGTGKYTCDATNVYFETPGGNRPYQVALNECKQSGSIYTKTTCVPSLDSSAATVFPLFSLVFFLVVL
jgi:hypothetical protein